MNTEPNQILNATAASFLASLPQSQGTLVGPKGTT